MTHPALIGVAAARSASFSMTLLESIEAMALEALDVSPLLADIPVLSGPVEPPRRRRLAFVGIGASGTGTSHRIDELLADGFGRDGAVLIVDTGPLVAAADRTDPIHQSCARLLETDPGPLVTTPLVVAETVFLITRQLGPGAEVAFYDAIIDGELTVEDLTIDDSARVRVLVDRYQNMPLGGTDASVIAVAERHHVTRIATIDRRHFSVVRPAHCPAFELLPA